MKIKKLSMLSFAMLMVMLLVSDQVIAQWKSVKGNGKVETRERRVSDFSGIKISCSADVFLKQGNSNAVTVRADENLIDMIETDVRGDVLNIDIDGNIRNVEVLEVYVTVKNLQKVLINGSGDIESENAITGVDFEIQINGSGDVELELDVKNLETKINGSGDVEVSGVQGNFDLQVAGSGNFEAEKLRLNECHIKINGSGDVKMKGSADKLFVNQSASGDVNLYSLTAGDVEATASGSGDIIVSVAGRLKARLSGSGDLTYKGEPLSVDVSASGSGEVYHR
jgi:hypothetical protein